MATTDNNGAAADGLWVAVSELARQKSIDKAAMSRRIARFEAEGLLSTRPGPRGAKLINVAAYERVAGEHLDATKELAAHTAAANRGEAASSDPVLSREQARRVAYQADIARLDLGERTRRLVPVDRVEEEAARLVEPIVKALDRLPSHAEAIVSAHNESGQQGVRTYLKGLVATLRNDAARALAELAAALSAEPRRPIEDFDPNPNPDPDPDLAPTDEPS
ncbi:DUF1441 family protein [Xanthobacter tagetidis]|uniref:DUF1441 family protein n=1 Tax=Xanthobacter tagetidis TaxID=60216 RepID=UPI0011C3B20C|nr:DUF1441 family protein [Xanthobacter tagetidis]MBB6308921.1 DNA-binding MarR family transcriptional regulator [Xanthobacter tagetidis]